MLATAKGTFLPLISMVSAVFAKLELEPRHRKTPNLSRTLTISLNAASRVERHEIDNCADNRRGGADEDEKRPRGQCLGHAEDEAAAEPEKPDEMGRGEQIGQSASPRTHWPHGDCPPGGWFAWAAAPGTAGPGESRVLRDGLRVPRAASLTAVSPNALAAI
jgi:hypothetical protein